MAVYGFKGLGWFAVTLTVALGGYMVMAQGAAERAKLHTLEVRIADAKRDIRNLDTEFATRASLTQLARWNVDSEAMRMGAPAAQQFVADETALATLDAAPAEKIEQVALAAPTAAPKAEPAVATRDPSATASASRPSNRAVAMVDTRQLLSSSTLGDLDKTAAVERRDLH